MALEAIDPSLIADFLTESGELIEQLDADLVRLEDQPESKELLDGIFRALHTIKGAASFLNMPAVTTFAHAAEDALNKLRKGEVRVDEGVIDAMLRSVDVLRGMLADLGSGKPAQPGPQDLIDRLHEITEGAAHAASSAPVAVATVPDAVASPAPTESVQASRPLALSPEKLDLLPGMPPELKAFADALDLAASAARSGNVPDATTKMCEAVGVLRPTADYFDFASIALLFEKLESLPADAEPAILAGALIAAADQIRKFEEALAANQELLWSSAEIDLLLSAGSAITASTPVQEVESTQASTSDAPPTSPASPSPAKAPPKSREVDASSKGEAETTVRVEVGRLEALLNLVGEMVLTKNQVLGFTRQLRGLKLPHEMQENINSVVGSLDRLTSELQVGVMRTRLQPLNKLFGRYPRVVRDLARATGKQIEIEIVGGETEVDKSVLEQLADPMVHILRNSADHGVERPDVRTAAGKTPFGTIRVIAMHQGGHVRVLIQDDGKGVDPEIVSKKALEKGLITAEQAAQMSDQEKVNLIFAPGFSTAEKVSDLSGRGVGMDVVRTNILKLGGSVSVMSIKGKGTTIEVLIPLTVAIMSAMMVHIGRHQYALPVACITEIVRLDSAQTHSVAGKPVIRLRETVLPLIDMVRRLNEIDRPEGRRFAVVVEVGQQRAGLMVDELIGQQEVVIKPLDDRYTTGGPFSGATIREDGDVSLIIDATQLIRSTSQAELAAA